MVKVQSRYSEGTCTAVGALQPNTYTRHSLPWLSHAWTALPVLQKKKCSLVAAHDRNSYETRLEHSAAHDWRVRLVLELAVCARRKQGAPQGSVLSPAQTPERGLGRGVGGEGEGIRVWKNNSQRVANSQKQYSHKKTLASLQWKQLNWAMCYDVRGVAELGLRGCVCASIRGTIHNIWQHMTCVTER